jgi:hypothetical protein
MQGGNGRRCQGAALFVNIHLSQPGVIYPGNDHASSVAVRINSMLNQILPGSFESVSSEEIALVMISSMKLQISGDVDGVHTVRGGRAITNAPKDFLLDFDERLEIY